MILADVLCVFVDVIRTLQKYNTCVIWPFLLSLLPRCDHFPTQAANICRSLRKFFTCAWRRCSRWGELCLSLSNTLCISLALFFVLSFLIPKSALISQYSWLWLREELVNACPLGRDTRRTDGRRCNVGWQVAWLVWRRPDQDLTFFQLWFHRDWIAFFAIFTAGWGGRRRSWLHLSEATWWYCSLWWRLASGFFSIVQLHACVAWSVGTWLLTVIRYTRHRPKEWDISFHCYSQGLFQSERI